MTDILGDYISKKQKELQQKNKEILELLEYFHENYKDEGVAIVRNLRAISVRINEMMTEDAKNESDQH